MTNNINFPRRHFHFKEMLTQSGFVFDGGQLIWHFTLTDALCSIGSEACTHTFACPFIRNLGIRSR